MDILISEDDEDVRTVIKLMLKRDGVNIQTTSNGLEALNTLKGDDSNFDILITDFNMPKMSGYELVKELFNLNIQLKKIIIMSGLFENSEDMEALAEKHSNISFLFKPISQEKLLKAVF